MSSLTSLSLDGTWSFTTDPHERGEREAWFERTSGFGRLVEVPSAWQRYGRDLMDYCGSAWYYRACEIPAEWAGQRVRLCFQASDYLTRAWVNGRLVGEHEGGFTPFAFELTEHLTPGESCHVVIRVYDPRDISEVPHGEQGRAFTRVSGIWQGLRLEARPPLFVEHVAAQPRLNPDRFELSVTLSEPRAASVRARLLDQGGQVVAEGAAEAEDGVGRIKLEPSEARRWSPDNPYLYTVEVAVGAGDGQDTVRLVTGLREIAAIDGRLYLNGAPLMLRGAVCQGYWPGTLYEPPTDDEIQRELRLAKEAGINVLRKHGKVEDPRYLDWCDRLGMLIWAEAPSCSRWTAQARGRFRRTLIEMLRRDAHRPSIIAWSILYQGRGLEAGGDRHPWVRSLHDEVAAADPTRPICTHAGGSSMRTDMLDEHHRQALPEEARAWDAALAGDLPAAGAPRVISEFGMWGLPAGALTGGEDIDWTTATWPAHADEAKWPRTAEVNFERYKLAAVFEDFDNLAKLTQRRLTRGVKGLIEQLRCRPSIAGYVARGFTDVEWEASGALTYDRKPKLGFDEWASFNGPIAVIARLPRHNYWCGETIEAVIVVSNHSRNAIQGAVQWGVDGADCDGELEFEVPAFASREVGAIAFEAPVVARSQATRLSLRLHASGWEVNTNTHELTLSPIEAGQVEDRAVAALYVTDDLKDRLAAQGFQVESAWRPGLQLLAGSLGPEVREALDQGANVVFIAEEGADTPDTGFLSFRPLPPTDNWERSASVHYVQWDLFPQLPLNTIMGWEMEDLFPDHVIPFGNYGQGADRVTSNQADEDPANVLAGYFEGWIGNFAASMLLQSSGRGRLLTTTLRLGTHYGTHPIATQLLNRLLTEAHLFEVRTVYQLET